MLSQASPHAVAARFDRRTKRVVVTLDTGIELAFRPEATEGLVGATPADLAVIEITPRGHGLHWPALDADVSIAGLLAGRLGSANWMARMLGGQGWQCAFGGQVRRRADEWCQGWPAEEDGLNFSGRSVPSRPHPEVRAPASLEGRGREQRKS